MRNLIAAAGATLVVVLGVPSPALGLGPPPAEPELAAVERGRNGEPGPARPSEQEPAAPAAVVPETEGPGVIPDRYIVVFRKGASSAAFRSARDDARSGGATIHFEYSSALQGFAATLPAPAVDALRHNPAVELIEPDREIVAADAQTQATVGLDRIDQRNLPLDGTYTYHDTGAGVRVYVVDSGIRLSHSQFGGRAITGFDAIDGGSADDCNGHGTHVAGTIGGSTFGVAKSVTLVSVRVLNCSGTGTTSQVIAGLNWVTSDHQAGQPAVANMSLGGAASSALDTAVRNSLADGVTYVLAAGNENRDACAVSPARVAEAVTVGATTASDARASWSNYGTCLDLFAPGSTITSAWHTSDSTTNTISGTSMAAPHMAGVAALYLQGAPSSTPYQVRDAIVGQATTSLVTGPGAGSPNRLLYSRLLPSTPACATETYSGTLTGTGDADIQPNGTHLWAGAGTHRGCINGPANTDFDLALYRWNGSEWSRVAVSQGMTSTENLSYNGVAGYYYWRVYSYSGSGAYSLTIYRPAP